jgi:NADP-dependent 3-hydroxy acid dehydrogenase YdfG
VTDSASIASAVEAVAAEADGIEVLVNNAGVYPGATPSLLWCAWSTG